jgi:hypothetical protein
MGQLTVYGETRAVSTRGFPKLLWEALVRIGGTERPEYTVFQEKGGVMDDEYWARVVILNVQGPRSPPHMIVGVTSRDPNQAVQLVAYMALTQLCYDVKAMREFRASQFFPRHSYINHYREYNSPNEEEDPAVVQLTHFVEAQDTMTHLLLLELEAVRAELHVTRVMLKHNPPRKRSYEDMERSPPPASTKDGTPEGTLPTAHKVCSETRAYPSQFSAPSTHTTTTTSAPCTCPLPVHTTRADDDDEESEEDPEEREPHVEDGSAEE